jgi:general secretion pathway protein E
VLVTGPTGSGKTTTLYASMSRLETATTNIMTVEDPIEYDLSGIGQTQVNERIDMTFARALRSILRQDPDVIMIGEIRDLETAQIAVQASLTGHLVLATLHTNDAASAVTRLTDMGVEPFLLASSLLGVLAQRLVRQLCPVCKEERHEDGRSVWHPVGCDKCGHSGYTGRRGVYELLVVDDAIRSLIHRNAADAEILATGRAQGMRTLRDDAERWLAAGATSLEEVLRVTEAHSAMPAFRFEAIDAAGRAQKGVIDADSARAARGQLRTQGSRRSSSSRPPATRGARRSASRSAASCRSASRRSSRASSRAC